MRPMECTPGCGRRLMAPFARASNSAPPAASVGVASSKKKNCKFYFDTIYSRMTRMRTGHILCFCEYFAMTTISAWTSFNPLSLVAA